MSGILFLNTSELGLDQHTLACARNVPKTVVITLCECSIETMGPWDIIVGLQGCISNGGVCVCDVWQSMFTGVVSPVLCTFCPDIAK